MTNVIEYWHNPDTLWHLAGRHLVGSGYSDTAKFAEAIQAANQDITRWWDIADGTRIVIPLNN